MNSIYTPIGIIALLFTTVFSALYQSAAYAKQDDVNLEEIIVDAAGISQSLSRLPIAIDLIEGQQVSRAQLQLGLDESLVSVPGLVLQNRYNFAQDLRISIRGFGARANFGIRGVKIIVDGIPETLADGQGSIDSIDLASIGKIEIIRGPSSSLYGNASGGVINIETDFDRQDSGAEARFATGGDGYQKNQFSINHYSEKLSYIVSLSDLEVDGYREHSEHENRLLNSRMRYRFDDQAELKLSLSYTDQPVSNDPGGVTQTSLNDDRRAAYFRNLERNAGEALDQTRIGLHYQKPIGDNGELSFRNYHIWRDFDSLLPLASNGAIDLNRYASGGGIMYQHKRSADGGDYTTVIGLDYNRQDDDRKRFANLNGLRGDKVLDQRELVNSVGYYFQNQLEVNERWLLTQGLRYDTVSFEVEDNFATNSDKRTLDQFSPTLGSSYTLTDAATLYAVISTSFETPTTTELALADATGLNSELNPQEATNYELGIKGVIGTSLQQRYSLALFSINVDDEIIAQQDSLDRVTFVNSGKSSRKGIELSLAAAITPLLSASLAYTWSDFEFERFIDADLNDFSGNELPGLPRNVAHLALDYQHPHGLFATIEAIYLDQFALNNANSEYSKESTVTDFRAGYAWQLDSLKIEPFIGVSNLFNENYLSNARINAFGGRFFEAGPDRNVYGGVAIRYAFAQQ